MLTHAKVKESKKEGDTKEIAWEKREAPYRKYENLLKLTENRKNCIRYQRIKTNIRTQRSETK